jgi:hypothetical protein
LRACNFFFSKDPRTCQVSTTFFKA